MARRYITRTGRTVEERDDNFHETLAAPAGQYYAADDIRRIDDRSRTVSGVERLVNLVASILTALLILRFLMSLLNANQANGFVNFVYSVTAPIVNPFANLFNYHISSGLGYFDLPAVAAIVVVSLVAWVISRVLRAGRA